MLTSQAMVQFRTVQEHLEKQSEEPPERDPVGREGGMFPIRPVDQTGLPHRIGREPVTPEDQGDWFTPRVPEQYKPVPPTAEGHNLGSRDMANIADLVAQVTAANVHAGEAAASVGECVHVLQAAKASIEEARGLLAEAVGNSGAQTLTDYLAIIQDAESGIERAIAPLETVSGSLAAGMERGETFIGNALG